MTDFSGSYTSTLTIGPAQSPATVTETGRVDVHTSQVGIGVTGSGMLTNLGSIEGRGIDTVDGNGVAVGVTFTGTVINGSPDSAAAVIDAVAYNGTATAINIAGSLVNYAMIGGSGGTHATGVQLQGNSSLVNSQTGTISVLNNEAEAIAVTGTGSTVTNLGKVTVESEIGYPPFPASTIVGINLSQGGVIINGAAADTSARIEAREEQQGYSSSSSINVFSFGIDVSGGAGTVINYGTITASSDVGTSFAVRLANGGTIINGDLGDIGASITGIDLLGTGNTIINYGSLGFVEGRVDRFVVEPGASFTGIIQGATGSVLEFTSGSDPGNQKYFSGFTQVIFDPGVGSGGTTVISGTVSSSIVLKYYTDIVVSGGKAVDTLVEPGGTLRVSSGGVAVGTTVSGGGSVAAGGRELITNGGVVTGTVLSDGGAEVVSSGGVASSTKVHRGGALHISNGGVASGGTVFAGGELSVYSGGTAQSTQVHLGELLVSKGGVSIDATISRGREIITSGGVASSTNILIGSAIVSSGGIARSTNVGLGTLLISNGGVASGTTVQTNEGDVIVSAGGTAVRTTVLSGGELLVRQGMASTVIVSSGGKLAVSAGGVATHATIVGSGPGIGGGRLFVSSGGVVSIATVSSGGAAVVTNGGLAKAVTVADDGFLHVSSGGTASGTKVLAGGTAAALAGGTMLLTSVGAGGLFDVFHGSASGTRVSNGGEMVVSGSGVATLTRVFGGGVLTVLSLGKTVDTRLSGGEEIVSKGGHAISTLVSNGGMQVAGSGGTVSGTGVHSGGELLVSRGGLAADLTVSSGGSAEILTSGSATAPTIDGGTLVLDTLYNLAGPIDFGGHSSGSLVVSSVLLPGSGSVISGFVPTDTVDLAAIGFSTSGSVALTAGNVLVVSENGHNYKLYLDPAHNFTGDTFHIKDDGHGDTLVYETKNTPAPLAHAAPAHGASVLTFVQGGSTLVEATGNSSLALHVSVGFG